MSFLHPNLKLWLASALLTPALALAAERITIEHAGLAAPESVVHDTVDDVYYVSNINGGIADKDGNGFISRITVDDVYYVSNINGGIADKDGNGFISRIAPDGKVLALKWADGAAEGTTLHAPKGLSIAGRTLYAATVWRRCLQGK
jgi:hypothetical protein